MSKKNKTNNNTNTNTNNNTNLALVKSSITDEQQHFIDLCKMSQTELKNYAFSKILEPYINVFMGDGYVYAEGDIPVLLTAHLDTVHKELVKDVVVKDDKISSPQGIGGDDRCGVFAIEKLIQNGYRPYILFCEDEEIGGKGSDKFIKTEHMQDISHMKYMIEIDRANRNDAVFYECGNEEFQNYVIDKTGTKEAYGSFSDICNLSPEVDVASVNISCGYYKAHTLDEYVNFGELLNCMTRISHLFDDVDNAEHFDYQEVTYNRYGYSDRYGMYSGYGYGNYGRYGYGWYDDDDYYGYGWYSNTKKEDDKKEEKEVETTSKSSYSNRLRTKSLMLVLYIADGSEIIGYGSTTEEAIGDALTHHMEICWNDVIDYDEYELEA